jgi:hypothetical protein
MNDVRKATRRAKHIQAVFENSPEIPEAYKRLTIAELKTHALARLGYSHSGVASALGVRVGTASRYYRRVGRTMGAEALQAAPPEVIKKWPYAPICVLGTRSAVTKSYAENRRVPRGWNLKQNERGEYRFQCIHGKVGDLSQSPSKRLGRVSLDISGTKEGCKCTDPLIGRVY